jgi:hypothetical protein
MHIRNALEAFGQTRADIVLADVAIAAWSSATRHVEDTIVREVVHDRIQVVTIECVQESLQQLYGHMLWHWRTSTRDAWVRG